MPDEAGPRPGQPLEGRPLGTVADDDEVPVEPGEGADGEVHPFVGEEPGRHQVELVMVGR